ncbi:MAG TPA: diguanylate cyclase [Candidatus Sulfotelmatobacter sp.]|jgi:diguanylate cyclase (GGDEF)-like protein|nr:diguanylate cyclase [Candidatus Sulfotelmatobacter sp.]
MPEITKRLDRADLAKRVERAEKLLQKGKTPEALEEYLLVLKDDPENDVVRQLAADLCLSVSRNADAVKLLGELFERQVGTGDATRASLTYKKLARHGNPTWQQKFRFGQLLEGSNKKLAVGTYEAALLDLGKLGKKQETAEILDRIVAIEATQANLLRVAELASELGNRKVAAIAFQRIAQIGEAEGGDVAQWYERAYQEDSSDQSIALAYGKSLLSQGQVGAAIFILEPQLNSGQVTPALRETYADALVAAGRFPEAEPMVWQLFEQNPSRVQQVIGLIGSFLDGQQDDAAVALARKLEQFQRRRGERRQFIAIMEDITAAHRTSPEILEFLSELYNSSNRENDYCQTLLKLFDLYASTGEFAKAAECLDRAAEVDPYEPGHLKRLEMLKGKVDDSRYKVIASRFSSAAKAPEEHVQAEGPTLGASTLQDLMLQAEILVQYGMRSKAVERLQRIQELFPREEERNEDLQRLYLAAGVTPRYAGSAPLPPAAVTTPISAAAAAPSTVPAPDPAADVRSFTRVAEITRKLYHQSTAPAVLSTAVKEIGGHWEATRCIAAMGKPGLPSSAMDEFCAEGYKKTSAGAISELVVCLQKTIEGSEPLAIQEAQKSPELQSAKKVVADLGASTILAVPLSDGEETVGILVLVHNRGRVWQHSDLVVLKTLADQMVIALNNAGLRRLVKNLSVTDEKSGLLKRASYIDLLLAESKRAIQNASALSVVLLQFGKGSSLVKEYGEAEVQAMIERAGQLFAANIRSNDLAFRYDTSTIAILLGETAEKEAMLAIEKLRKIISEVRFPAKDDAAQGPTAQFSAGVAEAVIRTEYDPADVVTEVINRVEHALAQAMAQGLGKVVAAGPAALAAGAVA